eukprot:6176083-Pleurochrysis_carterae.AAC.1
MTSFARSSSGRCALGTVGTPKGLSRVRSTVGPPSGDEVKEKWRDMEKVEHDGAGGARRQNLFKHVVAEYVVGGSAAVRGVRVDTVDRNPIGAEKVCQSTGSADRPRKRRRTRPQDDGTPGVIAVIATSGKPGGCFPSSALGLATGGASRWDGEVLERSEGRHGKSVSSKYTSDVLRTLREA